MAILFLCSPLDVLESLFAVTLMTGCLQVGEKKKKKLHLNFLNSKAGELLKACMSESF